jgi:hypothetical protein
MDFTGAKNSVQLGIWAQRCAPEIISTLPEKSQ